LFKDQKRKLSGVLCRLTSRTSLLKIKKGSLADYFAGLPHVQACSKIKKGSLADYFAGCSLANVGTKHINSFVQRSKKEA
jgi:hypothetical protein